MATNVSHTSNNDVAGKPEGGVLAQAEGIQEMQAALERALIDEYLREHGVTRASMAALPPERQAAIMRAAATFATLRLAEIESRAHFVDEID